MAGEVGTTAGEHIYGPYLHSIPPIPEGPNVGADGVRVTNSGGTFEAQADVGWIYNWQTGRFYANSDDLDDSGVGYDTY